MAREALVAALRRAMPGALHEADGRAALLPRGEQELADAIRVARDRGARLLPPGHDAGGADGVPIDLQRMREVLGFDEESRIVHVQAGAPVTAVDKELAARGLGLGLRDDPGALDVG